MKINFFLIGIILLSALLLIAHYNMKQTADEQSTIDSSQNSAKEDSLKFNKTDSSVKKQGLWVENDTSYYYDKDRADSYAGSVNKTDGNGKKQGLWVENDVWHYYENGQEIYNKTEGNGKKQGLWIENGIWYYYYDGQEAFANVNVINKNGKKIGLWMENGRWSDYDSDGSEKINANIDSFALNDLGYGYKYKGYLNNYDDHVEGWILWDRTSEEYHNAEQYGIWKYYDDKGKLVKEFDYDEARAKKEEAKKDSSNFNKTDSTGKKQGLWIENNVLSFYKDGKETHSDVNKTDSSGNKQGLWIEVSENSYSEDYYKDGILSGVYKHFSYGHLAFEGEYINGKKSWDSYYNEGILDFTFSNISENKDSIVRKWDKKMILPEYKCYFKSYYTNGKIKSEGWLLYYEYTEPVEYSINYGIWKKYNDKGELVEEKEYEGIAD